MLIRVGRRSGIRPLLFTSLTEPGRLRIFIRIDWLFSDVSWRLFKLLTRACIWTFLSLYFSHVLLGALGILCSCSWIRRTTIVEVIDDICNIGHFVSIMVMEVAMLLLLFRLSIVAFLSMAWYLLIFRLLIFFCCRLIQHVSPFVATTMLHCCNRRLIEVLRVARLLRINTELISSCCVRRLRYCGSIHNLLLSSLLRLLPLFFRHEMPFYSRKQRVRKLMVYFGTLTGVSFVDGFVGFAFALVAIVAASWSRLASDYIRVIAAELVFAVVAH